MQGKKILAVMVLVAGIAAVGWVVLRWNGKRPGRPPLSVQNQKVRLASGDARERRLAIAQLGGLKDAAVPVLKDVWKTGTKVERFDVIQSLKQVGTDEAKKTIREVLQNDKDGFVRAAAVDALGVLNSKDSTEEVLAAIDDGDGRVSHAAIRAIGKIDEKVAADAYRRLMLNDHTIKATQAVVAFGRLKTGKKEDAVWECYDTLSGLPMRRICAVALADYGTQRSLPKLKTWLDNASDKELREALAMAVRSIKRREGIPVTLADEDAGGAPQASPPRPNSIQTNESRSGVQP